MGGDGKDHAHVQRRTRSLGLLDDGLEGIRLDGVDGFAVAPHGNGRLHLLPDVVGHGDAIAVVVEAVGRDDVGLGTKADGGTDGLTREHVGSVQFARDDAIEENFPVRLRFEFHNQSLFFEEAFFLGDDERSAIGELDKAKLEVRFFHQEQFGGDILKKPTESEDGGQQLEGNEFHRWDHVGGSGLGQFLFCRLFLGSGFRVVGG